MKKSVIFLFLSFLSIIAFGQQDPQFSHFMFNGLTFNPAIAGSKESINVFGLFRNQIVGFPGAPKTSSISVHAPINSIQSGIGARIINDSEGNYKFLSMAATYAYKFELSNGNTLALGTNLGFLQAGVDGSKFDPIQSGDALIPTANISDFAFDMGLGAMYYAPSFYAGLSVTHLPGTSVNFSSSGTGSEKYTMERHFYLIGGYEFELTPDWQIKPSALIKFDRIGTIPQLEINGMAYYKQKVWGGISGRYGDALIALIGFNVNEKIKVGYSYDFTLNKLARASSGTHEFFLSYDIFVNPKSKDNIIIRSPRFL